MNETLSNNQDSLINQFLSLEIDKQISKSLSPGKESKSPMDGNDAKTDTEQHIDGREDSSPTKQSSASINSVNSYFENLTINSSSSTTNSSMISSGLLSSSNNNSINASSSQAYPLDYSSLNNPNDDILSFSSANSGLMSAIDSKVRAVALISCHLTMTPSFFTLTKSTSILFRHSSHVQGDILMI